MGEGFGEAYQAARKKLDHVASNVLGENAGTLANSLHHNRNNLNLNNLKTNTTTTNRNLKTSPKLISKCSLNKLNNHVKGK